MTKKYKSPCRMVPEYEIWSNMKYRCNNNHRYVRRGIKVCERWRIFKNFLHDMGSRPSAEYSIDRKNNDGNYEPGNCRWATPLEQTKNRNSSIVVLFRGKSMSLKEAVDLSGNEYHRVHHRISSGWDVIAAIEAPVGTRLRDWKAA